MQFNKADRRRQKEAAASPSVPPSRPSTASTAVSDRPQEDEALKSVSPLQRNCDSREVEVRPRMSQ